MKYSVINLSSRGVCLAGRNPIDIPANCDGFIVEFPDKETAASIIQRLKKVYPALKFTAVKEEVVVKASKMPLEEFTSKAKVESKGNGWCAVSVEGLQDKFNVRLGASETEEDVIKKAYDKYGESA